jgi:hypothetical protein
MHIFSKRTVRQVAFLMFATVALAGCGGGGGGGGAAPVGTPVPPPVATPAFPVLQTSSSFSLTPIADPAERTAQAGHQLGRVLLPNGTTAPAGLKVEWLDASLPASPRVIASAVTDANGAFDIAGTSNVAAADQWLRVTLADGVAVRGFASGWTELSFGTEVAVSEIARLRAAGALATRPLPMDELAIGQQSLSLLGQARYAGQGTTGAITSLTALLAQFVPWNQYLDRLSSATPAAGAGDVAAFLPFTATDQPRPATLIDNGVSTDLTVSLHCTVDAVPNWRECGVGAANQNDIAEQLSVRPGGIFLHNIGGPDGIDQLLNQIGDLPILEFAPVIGTRVIYNNPQIVQASDAAIHAAIKVTRRTYPVAPVAVKGGSVAAIEVVFDYEVAILNTTTKQQVDLLVRERRWFSPLVGRVRIASEGMARSGSSVTPASMSLTFDTRSFTAPTTLPLAGVMDAAAVPLTHKYVAVSAATNRLYVSTDSNGGQILELDASTLATLRTVGTAGAARRVAVSSDGTRIYAALPGATILELRNTDLGEVRRFNAAITFPNSFDAPLDKIGALAVDPFNAERVLLTLQATLTSATGPVQLYDAGTLQSSIAANKYLDAIGWTAAPGEFLAAYTGSPQSVFRFQASPGVPTELASLLGVPEVSVTESYGDILTSRGTAIDARSLTQHGTLALPGYTLRSCVRLDARSDLCEVEGIAVNGVDAPYIRFDHASGAYLGIYRPAAQAALAGCPVNPTTQIWTAAGRAVLQPLPDGRIIVSNGDADQRCGLQVWSLHGYQK